MTQNKLPFDSASSDGCSVPEIFKKLIPDLETMCALCYEDCLKHDEAYYYGGTEEDRLIADEALYQAIKDKIGASWALKWYNSIRLFGGSHWGSKRTWDGRQLWGKPAESP